MHSILLRLKQVKITDTWSKSSIKSKRILKSFESFSSLVNASTKSQTKISKNLNSSNIVKNPTNRVKNASSTSTNFTTNKYKELDSLEINIRENFQELGRVPIDYVHNVSYFPLATPEAFSPFDNYIKSNRTSKTSYSYMEREHTYAPRHYAPTAVVMSKGKRIYVEDVDGYKYIDCHSGYSTLNLGHTYQSIIEANHRQSCILQMSSRAIYSNVISQTSEYFCKYFNMDKVLFMNTGNEAVETALKFSRKWGYVVKGIPDNQAKSVFMRGNFWGRSITACSTSDVPLRYEGYGPFASEAFYLVNFNDADEVEELFKRDPNIACLCVEPIQGEGGAKIPDPGYFRRIYELCCKYRVIMIVDEIQMGIGRTGTLLGTDLHLPQDVRPHIICLGKAITNGMYPVSAVLMDAEISDVIKPGTHGSTYSGNPLGCATAMATLDVIAANNFEVVRNSAFIGSHLALMLSTIKSPLIKEIRARGLLIGIEFFDDIPLRVSDICLMIMEKGVIVNHTIKNMIRVIPALQITFEEACHVFQVVKNVIESVSMQLNYSRKQKMTSNILYNDEIKQNVLKYPSENPEIKPNGKKNPRHEKFLTQINDPESLLSEKTLSNGSFKVLTEPLNCENKLV